MRHNSNCPSAHKRNENYENALKNSFHGNASDITTRMHTDPFVQQLATHFQTAMPQLAAYICTTYHLTATTKQSIKDCKTHANKYLTQIKAHILHSPITFALHQSLTTTEQQVMTHLKVTIFDVNTRKRVQTSYISAL